MIEPRTLCSRPPLFKPRTARALQLQRQEGEDRGETEDVVAPESARERTLGGNVVVARAEAHGVREDAPPGECHRREHEHRATTARSDGVRQSCTTLPAIVISMTVATRRFAGNASIVTRR